MEKIELGSVVKDRITGLQGTAVARTTWLNGCVRYAIQPAVVKDGKPVDEYWVDSQQTELVKPKKKAAKKPAASACTGGPQADPREFSDPR